MFVPIDKPIQMPVAPSPIFKPAHSEVRSRLTSRQCRQQKRHPSVLVRADRPPQCSARHQ